MAGIRFDEDVINRAGWDCVSKDGLGLNVLMIGLDSMSHMMVQRKLPKVYSKLKSMGAHVLEGYNIVGDGTPQALIPILTGKLGRWGGDYTQQYIIYAALEFAK